MAAVLLEPSGEILCLPALPWLLPLQRPHFISRKSHLLCQFPESVIFLYCTSCTLHDTNTQVKVSFSFSCHLSIEYPYDGKISSAPGRAVWNPQRCLTHVHMWLQVGSHWRLLVVTPSIVLFTAVSAFCIAGCVSNYCLGFSTCVWFKKTDASAKEARSGSRYCWHYLHITRVRTTAAASAVQKKKSHR